MMVITRREGEEVHVGALGDPMIVIRVLTIGEDFVRVRTEPQNALARTVHGLRTDQEYCGGDEVEFGDPVLLRMRIAMLKRDRVRIGFDARNGLELHRQDRT